MDQFGQTHSEGGRKCFNAQTMHNSVGPSAFTSSTAPCEECESPKNYNCPFKNAQKTKEGKSIFSRAARGEFSEESQECR